MLLTKYVRFLIKNGATAVIFDLTSMLVGLSAIFLVIKIVLFEISYDRYHSNYDRIYRVNFHEKEADGIHKFNVCPVPTSKVLKEVSWVQKTTEVQEYWGEVRVNDKLLSRERIVFTNPDYFEIFSYKWIKGSGPSSLKSSNSVVISQDEAQKYFGSNDVIGNSIKVGEHELIVTGVLENPPLNSHLPFKVFASISTLKNRDYGNWEFHNGNHVYIFRSTNEPPDNIPQEITKLKSNYLGEADLSKTDFVFQKLGDIHFNNQYSSYNGTYTTSLNTIFLLVSISLLILLTTLSNHIQIHNFLIAKRKKFLAIRLSLGANRRKILNQLNLERFGYVVLLIPLSTALTTYLTGQIAVLNAFFAPITMLSIETVIIMVFLILIYVLTVVLQNILFTSRLHPSSDLKRNANLHLIGNNKFSLIFPLSTTFLIITLSIILGRQIQFIKNKDLGFRINSQITINLPDEDNYEVFLSELNNLSFIKESSVSMGAPVKRGIYSAPYNIGKTENLTYGHIIAIDSNYLNVFDLSLIAGENINHSLTPRQCIVNQELVKQAGMNAQDVMGKSIKTWDLEFIITGVVKDFHSRSLRTIIKPTILGYWDEHFSTVSLKIISEDRTGSLATLQNLFNKIYPDRLFRYSFVDDYIHSQYDLENKQSSLLNILTLLIIIINITGVFSVFILVSISLKKNFSIRKVLGAKFKDLLLVLFYKFSGSIVIAILFSLPLVIYVSNKWLNQFSYKIDLGLELIAIGYLLSSIILLIPLLKLILNITSVNPVKYLKE